MSQNLVANFAAAFVAADGAVKTRADAIRAIVHYEGGAIGDSPLMAQAVLATFHAMKPLQGLSGEAASEALNRFNATMRTSLKSALKDVGLTAKLSVKADKLIKTNIRVTVELAVYVEAEKASFTIRKTLESMQGQLLKLIENTRENATDEENDALRDMVAQFELTVAAFAEKL